MNAGQLVIEEDQAGIFEQPLIEKQLDFLRDSEMFDFDRLVRGKSTRIDIVRFFDFLHGRYKELSDGFFGRQ